MFALGDKVIKLCTAVIYCYYVFFIDTTVVITMEWHKIPVVLFHYTEWQYFTVMYCGILIL
jgi:hypothetical protein